MRIGRTLPPAAAPLTWKDILSGIPASMNGEQALHRFERELKEFFGVRHCFLVSSGKTALALILQGLHKLYPERTEVVIPAYTCYSVPSAVTRAGLKVRPCDIDPETLDYDFSRLPAVLSSTGNKKPAEPPLAILAIHLFGVPADVARVQELAEPLNIPLIEDAAQAMGGISRGKKLGTLSDISFFSLGRGKALSTVEGGILLTDRNDLAAEIQKLSKTVPQYTVFEQAALILKALFLQVFANPALFWLPKSIPALQLGRTLYEPHFKMRQMCGFQAGLAIRWMKTLEHFTHVRRRNTAHWFRLFQSNGLSPSCIFNSDTESLIRYPLRIPDTEQREAILDASRRQGLGIMPGYPDAVTAIPELETDPAGTVIAARKTARELITLPTHPYLTEADRHCIEQAISVKTQVIPGNFLNA
jgi:dTDP-4-amino-4,6-dideoxygalactose transaminase